MRVSRPVLLVAAVLAFGSPLRAAAAAGAPIAIQVDASDAPRKIFHVHETIPAAPGKLTLVYPKFIPGEHGPTGPITDLVGLKVSAGGKSIAWQRQPKEMWAFDVVVPDGASSLDLAFDYVAAPDAWTTATAQLAIVNWWSVMLYPELPGTESNELLFAPSLKLPAGWEHATSLHAARAAGDAIAFAPVSLVTLIDSPVLSGAHFKTVDLTPGQQPGHWLHLAGDSAASVRISEEDAATYRRLVAEAFALFGSRHYGEYHFLLTLSDHVGSNGLEHHESSDNRAAERSLIDPDAKKVLGSLLSHEYTHSWNGKYRRPAGLVSGVSADYQPPVDSRLLWVYEGLTEYWGDVLAGRSGMRTPEQYRENVAIIAGNMARQAGRAWRPLEDTATAAQLLYFGRPDWASWRRGVDFYPEGELVWLEVDSLIRQKTAGKKSLDDFAHAFHGGPGGKPEVKTYTFEDVVAALHAVAPNDWAGFFRERIVDVAPAPPFRGIEASGWRVVYGDARPDLVRAAEEESEIYDFQQSLGITIKGDGTSGNADDGIIRDAVPGMPAAEAGVGPSMRLVAINGRRYSVKGLREALAEAKRGVSGIELLVENVDTFKTCKIEYHDGEKFPTLERDAAKPDLLSRIGAARAATARSAK
ncbi:MAG TPA: M61 family peptidase [Thermoanaerobaculia bacterium]|nr:M61 family peptidase [Thermoanaerobaculia bacterium]